MANQWVQFDDNFNQLTPTTPLTKGGAGVGTVKGGGILNFQTASSGNAADSTDDTLHTYTLPANTLGASAAKRVRVKGYGTTAGNANTKTAKIFLGSASVTFGPASTATSAKAWYFEADFDFANVGSQNVVVRSNWAGSEQSPPQVTTMTQAETTSLVIKVTGASSASSASDITENTFSVEVFN